MRFRNTTIGLLILAFLLNTIPRYLDFSGDYNSIEYLRNYKIYASGQAASFFLLVLASILKPKDKLINILFGATLIGSFSNFLDELFFNPTEFNCNDGVSIAFIISYLIYNLYNLNKNK